MEASENGMKDRPSPAVWVMIGGFLLLGGFLIAISFWMEHDEIGPAWLHAFFHELGIVLFTVFTVSLLYELYVQEKYAAAFLRRLSAQLREGEGNAAACAKLGVHEIFTDRSVFEQKYPFRSWISQLGAGSRVMLIARSLFLVLGRPDDIKAALLRGVQVDLCVFHPNGPPEVAESMTDLQVYDVHSAIALFRKDLIDWVQREKPPGTLELRYYTFSVFDSFALFVVSKERRYGVWDLSFGRTVSDKRIILLDATKGLGSDLEKRYCRLWELAGTRAFVYAGGQVTTDKLSDTVNQTSEAR